MPPDEVKRSPGRPRNLPIEEQRQVILGAARNVFALHGYQGATIERVARTAGVARPAVYDTFGGKDELWIAVVDDAVERVFAWTGDRIGQAADLSLRGRVRHTVSALFDFIEVHPDEAAIIRASQHGGEGAHVEAIAGRRSVEDALAALIESGWEPDRGIPHEAARVLAVSCIAMVEAVGFRQPSEPGWTASSTIDVIADLLIGGFIRLARDRRSLDRFA